GSAYISPFHHSLLFPSPLLFSESASFVIGGEHRLGDCQIDESIGYSFSENDVLDTANAIFRTLRDFDGSYDIRRFPSQPDIRISVDGIVLDTEDFLDPHPYIFNRYDNIDDMAEDTELAMRLNALRKWESEAGNYTFKTGFKARLRDASKDQDRIRNFPTGTPFRLSEVSAPGAETVFRNAYPLGPSWSAAAMESYFQDNQDDFFPVSDSFAGDFSVSESIYATYGMFQRESERWLMIAGLRLERTDSETRGYEIISYVDDEGENVTEVNPVSISDSYDMWFPGFHVLYKANSNWVFRSSLTRTLQRPDFRDLAPSTRVNLDTKRIRAGNPDLEPFDAKAIDIGTDIVLNEWGSLSLGFFYKRIEDFIVDIEEEVDYLGEPGFILSRPVNGSPADLLGLEAAWSTGLAFLPHPFENTSLSFNYMWTDSTAAYPGQPGEIIMLPRQVRQTLNLNLRWRFQNWTVNLRTRYRGKQLQDLIEPGQDQFVEGFWSHSVSLIYKLNDTLSFSAGLANLNRPNRISYQGIPEHMVYNRQGTRNFSLGLNVKFGRGKIARLFSDAEKRPDNES
ncbi:MAG: TonB-dependent receptor, partial [Puniceicoccaceae bacterium]